MPAEVLEVETLHRGWSRLLKLKIRLPNGAVAEREVEDHGAAVAVLAYDPDRQTALLVRQLRAPSLFAARQDSTVEAIAGILEDEDPAACARREAMEEAGLKLTRVHFVATAWTMPGISTERLHLYLATYGADDRGDAAEYEGGEREVTAVVEVSLTELARQADAGELDDLKTLFLLQTLRLRQPELFTHSAPADGIASSPRS